MGVTFIIGAGRAGASVTFILVLKIYFLGLKCDPAIECLFSVCKGLDSNLSTTKQNKTPQEGGFGVLVLLRKT